MNVLKAVDSYVRAQRRLLLLDYDGTLAGFEADPMTAKPSKRLLSVLDKLAADPANTLVVISGRPARTLDAWLGSVRLGFSAEHGFLHKLPGGSWQPVVDVDDSWRPSVYSLMDSYVKQLPGSLIGEKTYALSWHWRAAADQTLAAQLEKRLLADLDKLSERLSVRVLRILRGNKVIEVHPLGFDKGTAARHWLAQGAYDFKLAIGDDTTDEDLFKAMPADSLTIKVGQSETYAKEHIENSAAVLDLLEAFSVAT